MLSVGGEQAAVEIDPGRSTVVSLALPAGTRLLEVRSTTFNPQKCGINDDRRDLGLYVGEIVYT